MVTMRSYPFLIASVFALGGCASLNGLTGGTDASSDSGEDTGSGEAGRGGDSGDGGSDGGPKGVYLISSSSGAAHEGEAVTKPMDTRGATLLVAYECNYVPATVPPTDDENNTWHSVPGYSILSENASLFYSYAPSTSANHKFTNPASSFETISVLAFGGTVDTASVLDTDTGSVETGSPMVQPGSVVPTVGELVVSFACSFHGGAAAGATIDDGFTSVEFLSGGQSEAQDIASAYLVAPNGNGVNPTWTLTGDSTLLTMIALFKAASP
jgi:hypothetical protein